MLFARMKSLWVFRVLILTWVVSTTNAVADDNDQAVRSANGDGSPEVVSNDRRLHDPVVAEAGRVNFDAIPWVRLGRGIAMKDLGPNAGSNVFVGYSAWHVEVSSARTWVKTLWHSSLRDLRVRYVFAVRGPTDPGYRERREIANGRIARKLATIVTGDAVVLVAAHSSGTYVAHDLFQRVLLSSASYFRNLRRRILYWNLDGGLTGLDPAIIARLRHVWFVWALNPLTHTRSANASAMLIGAERYRADLLQLDASQSRCYTNAVWCLHMTPIVSVPHNRATGSAHFDYSAFNEEHPLNLTWIRQANSWMEQASLR
jgi:hypothetical protein